MQCSPTLRNLRSKGQDVEHCRILPFLRRTASDLGGIQAILAAMSHYSDKVTVQRAGCKALHNIACHGEQSMLQVAESGGIGAIVAAMRQHMADPTVQTAGIRALLQLSTSSEARDKMMEMGAVAIIHSAMNYHSADSPVHAAASKALQNFGTFSLASLRRRQPGRLPDGITSQVHGLLVGVMICGLLGSAAWFGFHRDLARFLIVDNWQMKSSKHTRGISASCSVFVA